MRPSIRVGAESLIVIVKAQLVPLLPPIPLHGLPCESKHTSAVDWTRWSRHFAVVGLGRFMKLVLLV